MGTGTNLVSKIPPRVRQARSREDMERLLTLAVGNATLGSLNGVAGESGLPTMTVGDGSTAADTGAVKLLDFPMVKLLFGANAASKTFNYQVFLWTHIKDLDLYIPQLVARGAGESGTQEYAYGGTTFYFADTLTQTLVPRPGVYVHSAVDNFQASLLIDTRNAFAISVQTDIGDATTVEVLLQRGENLAPFELRQLAEYSDWRAVTKSITAPGSATVSLFTVTGAVEASIIGVCSENVVGAGANASVGISGAAQLFIPNTVNTALLAGLVWLDATPEAGTDIADLLTIAIADSTVLLTRGDAWGTSGIVTFYCRWRPVSPGALVVAA